MSKEELFVMHVYMCVCLYIDTILLIHYLCRRSLFKTSLSLFLENIHLEKLLTCLSILSLSVTAQVPFCDPTVGFRAMPAPCMGWELEGLIHFCGSSCWCIWDLLYDTT